MYNGTWAFQNVVAGKILFLVESPVALEKPDIWDIESKYFAKDKRVKHVVTQLVVHTHCPIAPGRPGAYFASLNNLKRAVPLQASCCSSHRGFAQKDLNSSISEPCSHSGPDIWQLETIAIEIISIHFKEQAIKHHFPSCKALAMSLGVDSHVEYSCGLVPCTLEQPYHT